MFITKKHIPRRAFLRGAGVTLALPFAGFHGSGADAAGEDRGSRRTTRFTGIFVPHGMAPGYWIPEGSGPAMPNRSRSTEFVPMIMKPLRALPRPDRDPERAVVQIGRAASGRHRRGPLGRRGVSCARNKPKKTTGADILDGTTIDQLIAQKIGQESLLPSLQLAIEDPGANSSNCGEGYSCAYTNSISWASPTQPLPMELNPQVVFERLFGDGGKIPKERAARREQDRSILDSVTRAWPASRRIWAPSDRATSRRI